MASVSRDPNGTKRVLFMDGDGERRTVRLGKAPVKAADAFRLRVEALLTARITGTPWDAELAAWVRDLPDTMHARLVRVGLVEPRQKRESTSFGALLDRFLDGSTVKPTTKAAYERTVAILREHFGGDRKLESLTPSDADEWRTTLSERGYASATISKHVRIGRRIFSRAVRWQLLASNPFEHLKAGSQENPDRMHYVPRETITTVIESCADPEWRAIIALGRYAGLRVPSEVLLLRWADVNWERSRLTVRSPKTAGHEGHAIRMVPIAPELRPILLDLFSQAPEGAVNVIEKYRSGSNLNPHFRRIVTRAGFTPWPRTFHNLRASCAMDWCERFPAHTVAAWMGHSPMIAARHYLQVRDEHFELAAAGAECGALGAQNAAQHPSALDCAGSHDGPEEPCGAGLSRRNANERKALQGKGMGATGLELSPESAGKTAIPSAGSDWPGARTLFVEHRVR